MADEINLTDMEIVALIKTFEPHDEGGQPMLSLHWALWKRILALGAIPRLEVIGCPQPAPPADGASGDGRQGGDVG